jgi:hypothetical protein
LGIFQYTRATVVFSRTEIVIVNISQATTVAQCANLTTIQFGGYRYFKQNVDALSQCANLTTVQFGAFFHKNVDAFAQCASLVTMIQFGWAFDQNVDLLAQCVNLTRLNLVIISARM